MLFFVCFKQRTAYEMRISDGSSDVCSSDLTARRDVRLFDLGQEGQGIVHVVGPELGLSQPGMTIVCGDSHTCTHGALGAMAWGIGSSELLHVLATQTIQQRRPKRLRVTFEIGRASGRERVCHYV